MSLGDNREELLGRPHADRRRRTASPQLLLAFGLVISCASAKAQESEPPIERRAQDETSASSRRTQNTKQGKKTVESTPPAVTRWDRFRESVWPFRARPKPEHSPPREERRTRWLVERDIKFAPGAAGEDDRVGPWEPKRDSTVSPATYAEPETPIPASSRSTSSASASPGAGIVRPRGVQGPQDVPQPADSLPPPLPDGSEQPSGAEALDMVTENVAAEEASKNQREPYGFCKRFLRGYPTLVSWFPEHLGPPREPTPGLPITLEGTPFLRIAADSEGGSEPARAGERSGGGGYEAPGAPRRSPPSPWDSPPFPGSEYQGYPLIGTPMSSTEDPLQKAILFGPNGDWWRDTRVEIHGWVTTSGNWSNASRSNLPTAYWIVPNSYQVDQAILRFEREIDWVQTDHIDWGFRWVNMYGIDYRYTTAGGIFSQQLLYHNNLYGYDPVEFWAELYIPKIFEGMVIRLGRWIACPDIEAQYAPDNYLASHSLLFTYDTYTQTGVMFSFQLNQRNMVQGAIQAGTDMAPWYPGALATGFFGWRWIAESNNDAFYTCLNNINNGKFRYFWADGHLAGHDNFNYIVTTWEHRFSQKMHTKTEAYYMWQFDGVVGGTPSLGPPMSFGGGGGLGKYLPGNSPAYGILNYTVYQLSKRDYFTVRNEWWDDTRGERSGYATNYSSHTVGISHQFNDLMMIRPEIGFYHSYNVPAFNLGKNNNLLMYGFDLTIRF
jgi:Putative beta-barrel porin-2, OmpL-like. bbp2